MIPVRSAPADLPRIRRSWLRTAGEFVIVGIFCAVLLAVFGISGVIAMMAWLLLALIAASRHAGFWLGVCVIAVLLKVGGIW